MTGFIFLAVNPVAENILISLPNLSDGNAYFENKL